MAKKISTSKNKSAKVALIMGSDSDWPVMKEAADMLKHFGIAYECKIVSAHRTPEEMLNYAKSARKRGLSVIIAGAGGAAHLPGMVASITELPVIGVPVPLKYLDGNDSLLSIVQMPKGVPVATVAIGNAANAGILAAQILGVENEQLLNKVQKYKDSLCDMIAKKNKSMTWR